MPGFEQVDLRWQPEPLWDAWPRGPDMKYLLWRMEQAFRDVAGEGDPGRLLDIACGNAWHAPELHRRGWEVFGLEPSPEMLVRAREQAVETGTHIELVRGIGEVLPYRDETFDRVLCMSSLDHFANPAAGFREMSRVLRPSGRLVVGIVNYGGVAARGSRIVYRVNRRVRAGERSRRQFWDDPTEGEHTFEGSITTLRRYAEGILELERAHGVAMLTAFPGWGRTISLVPGSGRASERARNTLLRVADRIARAAPAVSDFLILTWRRAS